MTMGDLVTANHLKSQVAKAVSKGASSQDKKTPVDDLVRQSMLKQPELLKAFPTMPQINPGDISNFQDYAYALHEQTEFMRGAIEEMRQLQDKHFMTKKNKELIREKKALEEELSLHKSSVSANTQMEV